MNGRKEIEREIMIGFWVFDALLTIVALMVVVVTLLL